MAENYASKALLLFEKIDDEFGRNQSLVLLRTLQVYDQ